MSPGDLIYSMRSLQPWHKSVPAELWTMVNPAPIPVGSFALVINVWQMGTNFRLLVLVNNKLLTFSHGKDALHQCWQYVHSWDRAC